MAYNISAFAGAGAQFFDNNGVPLAGGLLYVYTAGTTTPATTYTSNSGTTANPNPIVLDSAGRVPGGEIWTNTGVNYKFVVKTSAGVDVQTYDNIPGINDPTAFNNIISVTGTNTLIGTSTPPYTAYTLGMTISFVAANTNTGAVTIDLDGLGSRNIYSDSTTALTGGEIQAGKMTLLEYDGTRFQLTSAMAIGDGSITTAKLANGAVTTVKLADSAVETAKIADAAVTAAKLSSTAVTAANIADGSITAVKLSTGAPAWTTSGIVSMDSGYGSNAPVYGCRAWINFNAVTNTGTYGRSGTTVTVTMTAHGMSTGMQANLTFAAGTGGTATSGTYVVTVLTVDTFTITDTVSGTITGGTVTLNNYIRASANVSSVTSNATGDYTINFTTAMPDAYYAVCGVTSRETTAAGSIITPSTATTSSFRYTARDVANVARNGPYNMLTVFR